LHTLEKSKSDEISSEEVSKAIQQVAAANHTVVDEEQLSSIMTRLFGEADERSLRMMSRRDLRRALLS